MTSPRTLRAGALASAAAVLLGLAVTVAAPASADAALQVVNQSVFTDHLGYRHIVGEVVNNGTVDSSGTRIDIELYDVDGNMVDTAFTEAMVSTLGPGERSPFDVQLDPSLSSDHYAVVDVSSAADSTPPNHNFATTVTSVFKDNSTGARQIVGTVRNDNTTPAEGVELVFTFYGADGTALAGEVVSTETSAALAPGATARFTEAVNPDFPAYAGYGYLTQATSPASHNPDATPAPAPTAGPAETTLDCDPRMTLSTKQVVVGQSVSVQVLGTPGSTVTLEGYSRPSTTYLPIRSEVELGPDGRSQPFAVRPATNARVRMRVRGCSVPGTGQVITVTPVLSIAAAKAAPHRYAFSGKILPAAQNTGRGITLYYRPTSGSPVRRALVHTSRDGSYATTLAFASARPQTLSFYWATGSDQTNAAAKSKVRALLVY